MDAVEHAYQKNRDFHQAEFQSLGPATEVLWKGGEKSQHDRFQQILRVLPELTGARVLDVGCGFGDFLPYAEAAGNKRVDYCGIDLCGEMIDECRRRRPDAEFHQCGVLEHENTGRPYDFAIASGIFAMPNSQWKDYVVQTTQHMLNLASRGVAVNFLSSFSQAPSPESHYADPAETLALLMHKVSPWCVLAHDYRWNDFTVALFRTPQY